ncbi:GIY-YIG nuclease family protein [Aeromonas sp. s11]|uniref:GIY-YIG nuclease family protein n=1 Tax=Aeromonas sp. s11 TaxID=3138481 RepID=UPI0029B83159|nr:GIY-YIG nuclease family protein [Aeromonas veronii]
MSTLAFPGNWIYILITSSNYTRCKIGYTRGNVLSRYRHLLTADPGLSIHVAYHIPEHFGEISKIEAECHRAFQEKRMKNIHGGQTEWFNMDANIAEYLIDSMLNEICGQEPYLYSNQVNELCKLYQDDILMKFNPKPYEDPFCQFIMNTLNNN